MGGGRVSGPANPPSLVLVVDDDPDMLRVIRGLLEDEGLAVTTATDGGLAVAMAAERSPDLAVLDVTLPVLSGRQVAARLRELLLRLAKYAATGRRFCKLVVRHS